MTKLNRQHEPGAFYHVTQRGNNQSTIFFCNEDRAFFYLLLQKYLNKNHHKIHASCLMDNHIHLLIQAGHKTISQAMQIITTIYAKYLNRKFKTTGHRFQGRYYCDIIEQDHHLLEVLKYIHLNPVKAKMVDAPGDYFWSTHNHYMHTDNIPWIERGFCLSLFDNDRQSAIEQYSRYMDVDLSNEIIQKIENPAYGSIIGSENFVSEMQLKYELTHVINDISVEKILIATCNVYNHPTSFCKQASNNQVGARIRGITGFILKNYTEESLSTLARLTNRRPSSISRSAAKIADELKYNKQLEREIENIIDQII